MDTVRLGVLIWLFLPIPVYMLIRRWYSAQIRKYPSTTSGRIVNIVSYRSTGGEYYDFSSTDVTYVFDVAGTEYSGQGSVGGSRQPGEEIRVRYSPERPEESRPDDLRDKLQIWAFLGILVLLFELGIAFFTISFGLFFLFLPIRMVKRRPPEWTPLGTILALLFCLLTGLPLVAIGIYGLVADGFLDQNILWALWNH